MDKIIKFPQLQKWQIEPFNDIKDAYRSGKTFCIKSKRQVGKSVECELLLIYYAITYDNSTNIIIEPTNAQGRKIYKDITKMLQGSDAIETANATFLEITFFNGSSIYIKSAEQKENLRGYTVNGICIYDEAAYLPEDVFSITSAWVDANNAVRLFVSTPAFKVGKFYDIFMSDKAIVYDWNNYDTSIYLSKEKLEEYRKELPYLKFTQDYLGLFADMNGSVFGDFSKCLYNTPYENQEVVFGIDWGTGTGNDDTAIYVASTTNEGINLITFNNLDETETINRIIELVRYYRPKKILVEKNSIGNVYYGLLKKAIQASDIKTDINVFNTTNESKERLVNNLQVAIQNNTIKIINNSKLSLQLSLYEMKLTETKKKSYNAPSGYHDDCIIALMLSMEANSKKGYAVR